MKRFGIHIALLLLAVFFSGVLFADYRDDIGYTQLLSELGAAIPDGSGIVALQVEAPQSGAVLPNFSGAEFIGKTLTPLFGVSGNSNHATTVARYFYGNQTSIASGIADVSGINANAFLNEWILQVGAPIQAIAAPENTAVYRVQNHSWVGDATGNNTVILNRLDFMINRDNVVSVVGLNNGASDAPLLSRSYNSISVGVTSGNHPHYTTGVHRPDIVAPAGVTSNATPMVSAAAAVLLDAGEGTAAENATVVKSLLMAGATKSEFFSWSRSDTRPLDNRYGAGELNIYNSYRILMSGEQSGQVAPGSTVLSTGWDFNTINTGGELSYVFDLSSPAEFTASLNWNVLYSPGGGSNYNAMTVSFADLNLYLYSVQPGEFSEDILIQQSISTDQNVEYLWLENLEAGRYFLKVTSISGNSDYALAWRALEMSAIPEPRTGVLLLSFLVYVALSRCRKANRSRA